MKVGTAIRALDLRAGRPACAVFSARPVNSTGSCPTSPNTDRPAHVQRLAVRPSSSTEPSCGS